MYRTLLVPFDGSTLSAEALPVAIELARRTGATVHLAMVHDPAAFIPFVAGEVAVPVYDADLEREHRVTERAKLDEAVALLRTAGIPVIGSYLEGDIADSLEQHATRIDADLTVMTTHGRGGFQRLRLGSVTTKFITRITHPALLLRVGEEHPAPAFPGGPVVCALDGTPFSEAVLPVASAFARATGLPLHLVAVTVPHAMPMAPFGTESLLADDAALVAEESGRREYLTRICASCPDGTTHAARTDMSVSRAILEEASARHAGVIAIATHGRSGIARFVLGSTTDEVIRHSDIPVLVYRPHTAGH